MPFATGLALALSTVLNPSAAPIAASNSTAFMPVAQTVEEYIKSYFADEPLMIDIARCESQFRQYDADGSVHRGVVNNKDVGVMQVNEYYHSAVAKKLGLDLYTIQGNVAYARYLYDKEGLQPWVSSSPCWDKAGKILARK